MAFTEVGACSTGNYTYNDQAYSGLVVLPITKGSFDVSVVFLSSPCPVTSKNIGAHSPPCKAGTCCDLVWGIPAIGAIGANMVNPAPPGPSHPDPSPPGPSSHLGVLVSPQPPLLWKFKTGQSIENAVAVANGIVYAGSDDDSVYALNATTGEKIWQDDEYSTTSQSMMSPTVADGIVYFSVTGCLYAADSMTGSVLWKYRVNQIWHNQSISDYVSTTSPVVKDNIVYLGSGSFLSALHAKTGELKWIIQVGTNVYEDTIAAAPTVAEGIVHFSANEACTAASTDFPSDDACIYAADANSGAILWKYPTLNRMSSPAVSDGIVYTGSWDKFLYALDAKTGTLQWKHETGGNVASPTVEDGVVYFGSWDGNLYAADAKTGAIRWTFAVLKSYRIRAGASVDNGIVYFGSTDNHLYAVNANSGALHWSYSTEDDCEHPPACFVDSTPVIADGILYVGSENYYMYAFNLKSGLGGKKFHA